MEKIGTAFRMRTKLFEPAIEYYWALTGVEWNSFNDLNCVFLVMYSKMVFEFLTAASHCCLMFNWPSTRTPRSFSYVLLPSQFSSSYTCGFYFAELLVTLKSILFISAHCSSLSRSFGIHHFSSITHPFQFCIICNDTNTVVQQHWAKGLALGHSTQYIPQAEINEETLSGVILQSSRPCFTILVKRTSSILPRSLDLPS